MHLHRDRLSDCDEVPGLGALSVTGDRPAALPLPDPASAHATRDRYASTPSSTSTSAFTSAFPSTLRADERALPCRVRRALSFLERARGLLWRAPLQDGQALWIASCASIHTVGMRYAIDVVFLDAGDRVVCVAADVPPMRFRLGRGARSVVELRSGQARALGLAAGQRLSATSPAADTVA